MHFLTETDQALPRQPAQHVCAETLRRRVRPSTRPSPIRQSRPSASRCLAVPLSSPSIPAAVSIATRLVLCESARSPLALRRKNGRNRLSGTGAVVLGRPSREIDDIRRDERLRDRARLGSASRRPRSRPAADASSDDDDCRSPNVSRSARRRARQSEATASLAGCDT